MSKVLVDRELLELLRNFTFLHDDGCAGALRGNIDKALAAQPAEADGPSFAEVLEQASVIQQLGAKNKRIDELQASLSAVTAERDRLRDQVKALQSDANSWQSGYDKGRHDGTKHRQSEVGQLRAEVEALRVALRLSANRMDRLAIEFEQGSEMRWTASEWAEESRATMAAKEA